ncbi:MAG: GrpB family protein [Polymorphobacter sp.]
MLDAISVSLVEHDSRWAGVAAAYAEKLGVLGDLVLSVHHIGSTSVPGLLAKPIIDLLPVVSSIAALDDQLWKIEALGYRLYGEYGLPGRRFCALPGENTRLVHLHFFEQGSDQIFHNLAFRDYMRSHPDAALAYATEKRRARALHPENSHGYTAEKAAFVQATSQLAHAWFAEQPVGRELRARPA